MHAEFFYLLQYVELFVRFVDFWSFGSPLTKSSLGSKRRRHGWLSSCGDGVGLAAVLTGVVFCGMFYVLMWLGGFLFFFQILCFSSNALMAMVCILRFAQRERLQVGFLQAFGEFFVQYSIPVLYEEKSPCPPLPRLPP